MICCLHLLRLLQEKSADDDFSGEQEDPDFSPADDLAAQQVRVAGLSRVLCAKAEGAGVTACWGYRVCTLACRISNSLGCPAYSGVTHIHPSNLAPPHPALPSADEPSAARRLRVSFLRASGLPPQGHALCGGRTAG